MPQSKRRLFSAQTSPQSQQRMSEFRVSPYAKPITAELRVPGDKSISHRAAMLAGLSNGTCTVTGFLASEDCLSTVECMRSMGVKIRGIDEQGNDWSPREVNGVPVPGPTRLHIEGCGMKLSAPAKDLDCGNSGTTMRLLSGILAAQPFSSRLTGDASLSRRPMKRVMDPLGAM